MVNIKQKKRRVLNQKEEAEILPKHSPTVPLNKQTVSCKQTNMLIKEEQKVKMHFATN